MDSHVGKGIFTPYGCSGGNRTGASVAGFPEFAAGSFSIELSHQPACSPLSYQLYALFSKGPAYSAATPPGVLILNQTTTPYGGGDLYRFRLHLVDVSKAGVEVNGSTQTFSCTTEHHVVAIRDRALGLVRLYVDGGLEGEVVDSIGDLWPSTTLYLGGANFEGGCAWGQSAGTMDAAAVYRRALTPTEVSLLHARWLAGKLVCGP